MGEAESVQLFHPSRIPIRWVHLIADIVAMMALANLQYAWTLFTKSLQSHLYSIGGWRGGGPRQPSVVSGPTNFT